jgi:hypothetical protein
MKTHAVRLLAGLVLFGGLGISRAPHTIADIAGDGAVHAIDPTGTLAQFLQIQAHPHNSTSTCGATAASGCPRIGDASISTTRGSFLLPGSGMFLPPTGVTSSGQFRSAYDLSQIYYLVQIGDHISIVWYD